MMIEIEDTWHDETSMEKYYELLKDKFNTKYIIETKLGVKTTTMYVDINTLKDLLALKLYVGHPLIIDSHSDEIKLEIYDDYRE